MAIKIREIESREDFLKLTPVLWIAHYEPYLPVFSARHPVSGFTKADRAASIEADGHRMWDQHLANPASHWIAAIDTETNSYVGGTEWLIFDQNPFPKGPRRVKCTWYPEDSEVAEYVEEMISQVFAFRGSWMQKPHTGVDKMGIIPQYRRQGIGNMLMRWGLQKTDAMGVESFIEATGPGRRLYEQHGYKMLLCMKPRLDKVSPSDEWKRLMNDLGAPEVYLMWRPAKGSMKTAPWEAWAAVREGTPVDNAVLMETRCLFASRPAQ